MSQYATFLQGGIIFFTVGIWVAYLDSLFQDEFTDNDSAGRGFWTTVSLTAIAVAVLLLVHYLVIDGKGRGTSARKQFLNIHAHETRAIELSDVSTTEGMQVGAISVGV